MSAHLSTQCSGSFHFGAQTAVVCLFVRAVSVCFSSCRHRRLPVGVAWWRGGAVVRGGARERKLRNGELSGETKQKRRRKKKTKDVLGV